MLSFGMGFRFQVLRIAAIILFWHVLILWVPGGKYWLTGLLIFAALTFLVKPEIVLLLSGSLLAAGGLAILLFNIIGFDERFFYDPASRIAYYDDRAGHIRYRPNRILQMRMPHGNLPAIGAGLNLAGIEREAAFVTDSWGFRNEQDYQGQKHVLVGDSFIVGNGSSQEDTLSAQLFKIWGDDSYSIACPGYIQTYGKLIETFRELKPDAAPVKYFIFFYEGNDFPEPRPEDANRHLPRWKKYVMTLQKNSLSRFLHILQTRKRRKADNLARPSVSTFRFDGETISVLNRYALEVSERDAYEGGDEFDAFLSRYGKEIGALYFIPTKYRVYYDYLNQSEIDKAYEAYMGKKRADSVLGNVQWEFLKRKADQYGIPAVNLTPALKSAAAELRDEGELVFWGDDTHWNGYGTKAAAGVIHQQMALD